MVAEEEQGEPLGFNWATRSRFETTQAYFYIIVKPEFRRQGAGSRLYQDVEQAALKAGVKQLQITVRDRCPEGRAFAERRGFTVQSHQIGLELDLRAFDTRPFDRLITRLQNEGIEFTSMEALGDTEEAQHKLYLLNDSTAMEAVVPDSEHSWLSFKDFQKTVCQMDWYKPGGQLVAIDKASGTWAAMSAITRLEGSDQAHHLHTGVDRRYHGRGLALAMLVLALRYARDVLQVECAHAGEDAQDESTIAVYRELGYAQTPGSCSMVKAIDSRGD
jgi:GNAT superfamily N-acetyltransferase